MPMRHVLATVGKIALGCIAVLALVGLTVAGAYLGLGLSAGMLRLPITSPEAMVSAPASSATPAEIVATRFPAEDEAPPTPAPTFSTASVIPGEHGESFDLSAVSGLATAEPPWPAVEGTAPAAGSPEEPELARQSEPARSEPAKGSPRRETARWSNVLNDAMIASIRRRLNLTSEQQKLWPAVEAALRKIVYTRAAMSVQGRGGQPGGPYIDPASTEMRELKSAALPLLMHLNSEQKSEVKKLVYIMGLEAVASQF
jgi:hypothetical protein